MVSRLLSCTLLLPIVAGAQSPFERTRLVPRSDSFVVMLQGRAVGGARETVERTPTGFRLTSVQSMAGMSQTTEVTFTRALEMREVKQTGLVRGAEMKIAVTYAKGRARGSATTPGAAGMRSVTVDTVMPPGAVDDNALQSLLHTLPLAPGKSFTVQVFSSGKGTYAPITLAVSGDSSVTVPAGTFEAWKLDATGGPIPVRFWVSKKTPRVVKLDFAGAPMTFELVK